MKKITTTQKVTFMAVLIFASVVYAYMFIYEHINSMYVELNKIKGELVIMDQITNNKQSTMDLINESSPKIKELNKYFVSLDDPTAFLEMVESLSNNTGASVQVESLNIEDMKKDSMELGTEKQVKANVLLDGKWSAMYHTIFLIEEMPYIVTINNVAITLDKETNNGSWSGQVNLICDAK